mgnify:CR=1 FL=1
MWPDPIDDRFKYNRPYLFTLKYPESAGMLIHNMGIELTKLGRIPVARRAERRAKTINKFAHLRLRCREIVIALTIRCAVETYENLAITFSGFVASPESVQRHGAHFPESRNVGYTGVTAFRANIQQK